MNHASSQSTGQSTGIMIWLLVSFVYGLARMWIYAGIRNQLGPGPKAAITAGLILWLAGGLTAMLIHNALDDIPGHIALTNCIAYLKGLRYSDAAPLDLNLRGFFYSDRAIVR